MGNLETIYLENIGESIVFLWAEEIRQFIQNQGNQIFYLSIKILQKFMNRYIGEHELVIVPFKRGRNDGNQ